MATEYNIDKFVKGINGFGLPACDTIYSATLTASTSTAIVVPANASMGAMGTTIYASAGSPGTSSLNKFIAVICCTPSDDVFLAVNTVAAVPVGHTFATVSSELIPNGYIAKYVKSGDSLRFISAGTPNVTVSFYCVQE